MSTHVPGHAVVTGGNGFIGSHLVERLVDRGDQVTVLDAVAPRAPIGGVRYLVGDLRDTVKLAQAIQPGVDVVYHLAAVVGVDQYLKRPIDVIDINYAATRRVLELAHDASAKVVLASTSEVFGKNPAVPWDEDGDRVLGATSADRWSYSSSKALAEHLTFAFARQYGLDATIVRYFNVYGPRQRPAYVVSRSVHRALNRRPLVIYDKGLQTRCFTYIEDAIDGTLRAAGHPGAVAQAFNIGSMVETTMDEVVRLIGELTGAREVLEVDTGAKLGASYQDLPRRVPNNAKAKAILGWQPETRLRDGLIKTIEWARGAEWWLGQDDSGAE